MAGGARAALVGAVAWGASLRCGGSLRLGSRSARRTSAGSPAWRLRAPARHRAEARGGLGRPRLVGDRRDHAILQLGGRLGPHGFGLEQLAELIELGTLIGRERVDALAGEIAIRSLSLAATVANRRSRSYGRARRESVLILRADGRALRPAVCGPERSGLDRPDGTSRRSAISPCVSSLKCWRRTTSCSSGGSPATAAANLPDVVHRLGRLGRRAQGRVPGRDRVERVGGAHRLAARHVDRAAPRDRHQPRPELALGIEGGGGPPRFDERLLGRLLRQTAVAEDPVGDGKHEPSVFAVDGAYGIGSPSRNAVLSPGAPRGRRYRVSGRSGGPSAWPTRPSEPAHRSAPDLRATGGSRRCARCRRSRPRVALVDDR